MAMSNLFLLCLSIIIFAPLISNGFTTKLSLYKRLNNNNSKLFKHGPLLAKKPRRNKKSSKTVEYIPADEVSPSSNSGDDEYVVDIKSNDEIDSKTMAKLKAEIATPFRGVRYFLYGSVGASAGLASFINIPQLISALQNPDGDKVNAVLNLVIDLGGVIGAGYLWYRESQNEKTTVDRFTEKQLKIDNKLAPKEVEIRDKQLTMLPVEIQVSEQDENVTRTVSMNDLMLKGKQNVIIVVGKTGFVRDAIISARLEGNDLFNAKDTMVIPYIYNSEQLDEGSDTKGFAAKEKLMTAPYIAKPKQLNVWQQIMEDEATQAGLEGTSDVLSQGMVFAFSREGKLLRRGLGNPPWKDLIDKMK